MPKEIYESNPISIPEVRQLLIDRAKEGEELSYMQRIALEHAHLTSRISAETANHLIEELVEKFSLSKKGAITLANFIPDMVEEIKVLLGKESGNFEQETFEEMLELLLSVELLSPEQAEIELESIDEEEEESFGEEEKEVDDAMIPDDLR